VTGGVAFVGNLRSGRSRWSTSLHRLMLVEAEDSQRAWHVQALCTVERQVVAWFGTADPVFDPRAFPVFVLHDDELGYYYGFPTYGNSGLKIGESAQQVVYCGF